MNGWKRHWHMTITHPDNVGDFLKGLGEVQKNKSQHNCGFHPLLPRNSFCLSDSLQRKPRGAQCIWSGLKDFAEGLSSYFFFKLWRIKRQVGHLKSDTVYVHMEGALCRVWLWIDYNVNQGQIKGSGRERPKISPSPHHRTIGGRSQVRPSLQIHPANHE